MPQINIIPSEYFKNSLKPIDKKLLMSCDLPNEILEFLTQTGLPIGEKFAFNANITIAFCDFPCVKRYPYLQHDYLYFASMDEMGELSIDLHSHDVFQYVDECMPHSLVNSSIAKFMECLSLWLSFYPQLQDYVKEMTQKDPRFSLFENDEALGLIRNKIKEIDPYCLKYQKFFWRRMCDPDVF